MSSFETDARARASVAERVARLNESTAETAVRHEWQGRGNARPVAFVTAPAKRSLFPLVVVAAMVAAFALPFALQALTAPAPMAAPSDLSAVCARGGLGDECTARLERLRDAARKSAF